MRVLVLGAGVAGVATAYFLHQQGHEVIVVDRQAGPALETSFANAGHMCPSYATPWAAPGMKIKAAKWIAAAWLLRHDTPLRYTPRIDPHQWRWLRRWLGECNAERYAANKARMGRIARYSHAQLVVLRQHLGLAYEETTRGNLQVFRDQAGLDNAGLAARVLHESRGTPRRYPGLSGAALLPRACRCRAGHRRWGPVRATGCPGPSGSVLKNVFALGLPAAMVLALVRAQASAKDEAAGFPQGPDTPASVSLKYPCWPLCARRLDLTPLTTMPPRSRAAHTHEATSACRRLAAAACMTASLLAPAAARVTRIVIDEVKPMAEAESGGLAFEKIAGRAFGELDPSALANALINDISLAKDADGKVRYTATFLLTRPVDASRSSGLMWHEVPNRGNRRPNVPAERANGDIDLTSAWQGDNAGATAVRGTAAVDKPHWLKLPLARTPDGTPLQGEVFGRIVNRSGAGSQPLIVQTNPLPYKPVTLDTRQARLVSRLAESTRGRGDR